MTGARSILTRYSHLPVYSSSRPSAAGEGQPECGHFLAVAYQQDVAGQHRVVPGLALDRREPRELGELIGGRLDQRQLTLFRQHQQHVLIGQQDELAVAVASALPGALAVLEVDAREDAAVEAEGMAIVHDEVVEVGLQPVRGPALFDRPSAGSTRDRDAARTAAVANAHQYVAVRGQGGLHDGVAWPGVLPEERAVGERNAGRAGLAQQHDLCDSVDSQEMRRAVAHAVGRADPATGAGREVVGDELAGSGDDDDIANHQWRARQAPL